MNQIWRFLCSQKGIYFVPLFTHHVRNIFTAKVSLQKCSPLQGIRIVDLTRIVAGPYCSMILSDLGADVIKIEQPKIGDEARRWGPFINETDVSSYFVSLNRNKKSMCVNLKTDSGRTIIKELVKKCDILIENYIPGKLDGLGLGFNELAVIAPHLIYCSITGYGDSGLYKLRPGVDIIAASYGGLLNLTGPEDGNPCKPGVPITDLATGLYAYGAIMTALFQRQKTGVGQKIDCNLLSTQLSCLINIASSFLNANKEVHRLGTAHPSIVPYETFSTADSFITICALNDNHFTNICEAMSLDHLIRDDKFSTNSLRVRNREILVKLLKERFVTKSTKQWLTILEGSSFPYGPVNSVAEVFEDEHVKEIGIVNDMMIDNEDANELKENPIRVKVIGPAVKFSASENKVRFPPPALGEHTVDILKHVLNYSDEQVKNLMMNGDIL